MSTRDEINDAVNRFGAEMTSFGRGQRRDYPAAEKQAVLSLIAPPPAPSEAGAATITLKGFSPLDDGDVPSEPR